LGCASWSLVDLHGSGARVSPQLEAAAISAFHVALDCGLRVFDTARAYTTPDHAGHSENLITRALACHPAGDEALVATKAGHERVGPRFPQDFPVDTSDATIRRHVQTSLELLQLDQLWLLQLHWPPVDASITQVLRTFAALIDEGLVRNVGICNASLEQVIAARTAVPLASVQNRFSPFDQSDRATVEFCAEHAITYLAYSPLGGSGTAEGALGVSYPAALSRASELGVSIQRLALAWLLAQSPTLIPICGASTPRTVRDCAAATEVQLELGDRSLFH